MDNEEEIVEEPELTEKQLQTRKYIRIAFVATIVIGIFIVIIMLFTGGEEEAVEVIEEETPVGTGVADLVELTRIKNVPQQYYNAGTPLIANTPEELIVNLKLKGWTSQIVPLALGYSEVFTKTGTGYRVSIWLRVYPSIVEGREELYQILQEKLEDNSIIVSENPLIGSGGFVTNDGAELAHWFYYEPNIVAKATMLKSQGGTLQEVSDWAHRLNFSIFSVLN
tara:strand:+ start:662 stop:1333 length:672 start_codon:yes stop_codon:yes gene_type:complete